MYVGLPRVQERANLIQEKQLQALQKQQNEEAVIGANNKLLRNTDAST